MSETRSITDIVATLQAAVASGDLVMAPTDGQQIRQLRERVAELEAQRDRVLALCEAALKPCEFATTGHCTHEENRLDPDAIRAIYNVAGSSQGEGGEPK